MSWKQQASLKLRRWLAQPVNELGRFQRTIRWTFDLFRHCARELYQDRATEMAAALTYRTIFSLVPLLVLALLVFNSLGGFKSFGEEVQSKLYEYLGISQIAIMPAQTAMGAATPATEPEWAGDASATELATEQKLRVDSLINQLTEKVSQLNFKSIGAVGVIVLIWAALALVITVEQCFNRIYDCPVGRPWRIRIPIYWALITLGPVLFGGSLWLSSFLLGLAARWGLGWVVGQVTQLGALALSWLLLFLLYTLMPNTQVARRPALIGSLVAAILYEQGKVLFGFYISRSIHGGGLNMQIYGSLALLPLFLFWVYLTWLIVLFGLELTYTLQAMKNRQFKHRDDLAGPMVQGDPDWLIPLMVRIAHSSNHGQAITADRLGGDLNLPADVVKPLLKQLESHGLVHQVLADPPASPTSRGYMLSLPPQNIPMQRLLDLSHRLTFSPKPGSIDGTALAGWSCLEKLEKAQLPVVQASSLAQWMQTENARPPSGASVG